MTMRDARRLAGVVPVEDVLGPKAAMDLEFEKLARRSFADES